jgi:hypothetical protein
VVSENSAFTTATADTIGKSRRSVEIAAARGEALGDNLGAVTGASLDKGVELDAQTICDSAPSNLACLHHNFLYRFLCKMAPSPTDS